MSKKQKLELTWIGKDEERKIEPRILIEDPEKSYGDQKAENMLIHGDNLLALKALEQDFAGKIKCIYIDPPYNTGAAFESYDDYLEHSLWLSLINERLKILWNLLTKENGTILISINDDECHYLKVLCDELFGRNCFIATLIWNYEGNTDNQANIINYHEYILVYSKSGKIDPPQVIDPNINDGSKLYNLEIRNTIVKNGPKNPPKKVLIPEGFPSNFQEGIISATSVEWPKYSQNIEIKNYKTIKPVEATTGWSSRGIFESFINSDFQPVLDSKGQETVFELTKTGAIEAVKKRKQEKGHFISVLRGHGTTNQMRLMLKKLGIKFTYPKPVDLIAYLIEAFTDKNDYILDSFVGSGTTAHAVLKLNKVTKTNRKFIIIELNIETVKQILIPRLKAVVNGNEKANIEKYGGGFKFYNLAPSLLRKDKFGNWIIDEKYNANMLAAAICKHEGFKFFPDAGIYWKQGKSTETDYIFITTSFVTIEQLDKIHEEMKTSESLLICARAFAPGCNQRYNNITIKKIPQMVLGKCEFGKDNYDLNIINVPKNDDGAEEDEFGQIEHEENKKSVKSKINKEDVQDTLF